MAGHPLIDAQLAALAAQLPRHAVIELADGLDETYRRYLGDGLGPDQAAKAALTEFGDPATILDAFTRASPQRHAAIALLVTGPVVAALYAGTLISAHAWDWPIPSAIKLLSGAVLIAVVLTLVTGSRRKAGYRKSAHTLLCGLMGLACLDIVAIIGTTNLATQGSAIAAVAATASLTRLTFVIHALPRARH